MNKSLESSVVSEFDSRGGLHDEEAIEYLDRVQRRLDELDFGLCLPSSLP